MLSKVFGKFVVFVLFGVWCVCVCVRACRWVHARVLSCWGQRSVMCLPLLFSTVFIRDSISHWTSSAMQPNWLASKHQRSSWLRPPLWVSGAGLAPYVGTGDLNSGPQAYAASPLLLSSFPAPRFSSDILLLFIELKAVMIKRLHSNHEKSVTNRSNSVLTNDEELQREPLKAQPRYSDCWRSFLFIT